MASTVWRECLTPGVSQRLPKEQEEPLRIAIGRAQAERGGGRIRGEDIRQLLHDQFHLDYRLNGVYHMIQAPAHGLDFGTRDQPASSLAGAGGI
jgi:hypothetical protein